MKNRQGSKLNEELGGNRDKKLLIFSEARQDIVSMKQGKINIQFVKGPSQVIFKIRDCKNDSVIENQEINMFESPRKLIKTKRWKMKECM